MNLKELSSLSTQLQTQSVPGTGTRVKSVDKPKSNPSIGNPQRFAKAKTQNAKQFQAQRTVQTDLSHLAVISGQDSPQRVNSAPSKKSFGIGGQLQQIRQSIEKASANRQVSQLGAIKTKNPDVIEIPLKDILPPEFDPKGNIQIDMGQISKTIADKLFQELVPGKPPRLNFSDDALPGSSQILNERLGDLGPVFKDMKGPLTAENLQSGVKRSLKGVDLTQLVSQDLGRKEIQKTKATQSLSASKKVSSGQSPVPTKKIKEPRDVTTSLVAPKGPQAKISDTQATQASKSYQDNLKQELKRADPKSPVGRYYRLSKLLNEYRQYQKEPGKSPLAQDPDALRLIQGNLKFMKDELTKLAGHKDVQAVFQKSRTAALQSTFGQDYKSVGQKFSNYLLGDDFSKELSQMSPSQRKAKMAKAIMKLSAIDPKLAKQTLEKLTIREMKSQFNQKLAQGDKKAKAALQKTAETLVADYIKDNYPNLSKGSKVGEMMIEMLKDKVNKNPKLLLSRSGFQQAMSEIGAALKKSPQIPKELYADIDNATKGLSKANVHGSLMSKAAIFTGVYGLSQAKNTEQVLGSISSIVEGTAGLSKLGNTLGLASDAKFMKLLNGAGALGPLGDALGVGADILGAIRESGNEDPTGMYLKIVSAGAGTAGTIAGIALLAGASGPAAPVVAAGAAIVGIGTAVADTFFAESDKTGEIRKALRDTGISDRTDRIKAKVEKHLGYVWDNPDKIHSEFTKLKDPAEKTAFINGLLDRKAVWLNEGRAKMVSDMLNSMTHSELKEVLQNGLNTQMLGRILGEYPNASTQIATRLHELHKADPKAGKVVVSFMKGLIDGGHHASFVGIMKNNKLGEKFVQQLKQSELQSLVDHIGKSKKQADSKDRFGNSTTDHGKSYYWLMHKSSWGQFNQLMSGPNKSQNQDMMRLTLLDNNQDTRKLLAEFASWGSMNAASDKTSAALFSQFSEMLKNAHGSTAQTMADTFIDNLSSDQIKKLPKHLVRQLYNVYEIGEIKNKQFSKLKAAVPNPGYQG